jgi:hypothetical protein
MRNGGGLFQKWWRFVSKVDLAGKCCYHITTREQIKISSREAQTDTPQYVYPASLSPYQT